VKFENIKITTETQTVRCTTTCVPSLYSKQHVVEWEPHGEVLYL